MQCRTCSSQLPPAVQFCPGCGAATPYNAPQEALIDPTVVSSPYQPSSIPPTSYGTPPPSSNPPAPDPYAQYNTPPAYNVPGQQPPYGYNPVPQAGQQTPYNPVPQPGQQTPYNPTPQALNSYQQYGTPAPNYNPAQPFPVPPTIPPRKSQTGLIIGITALVLAAIIVGLVLVLPKLGPTRTAQNLSTPTPNAETKPTPTPEINSSTAPSGLPIDSTAASIVTNPQTSADADQETAAPINLTSTFKTYTNFYVTFKLNNSGVDFSKNPGYVSAKFYARSSLAFSADPLAIDRPAPGGYFKVHYNIATPGTAELYWCQKSDCSDEKLAQTVTFTVTD